MRPGPGDGYPARNKISVQWLNPLGCGLVAPASRPYHHGHLRPALIDAAVATVEDQGLSAMSLRGVARRAGVSHAAATYHFGDKAGLLTGVAVAGYQRLAAAPRATAATELYRGDQPDADRMATGIAAWALMHGVATLWLNGNMPPALGDDP